MSDENRYDPFNNYSEKEKKKIVKLFNKARKKSLKKQSDKDER